MADPQRMNGVASIVVLALINLAKSQGSELAIIDHALGQLTPASARKFRRYLKESIDRGDDKRFDLELEVNNRRLYVRQL